MVFLYDCNIFVWYMKQGLADGNLTGLTGAHKFSIPVLSYFDGDDGCFYFVAPSLDIVGAGKTETEAQTSFEIMFEEFAKYTSNKKTIKNELFRLGWEVDLLKKKSFVAKGPTIEELRSNPDWAEIWQKNPRITNREITLAL